MTSQTLSRIPSLDADRNRRGDTCPIGATGVRTTRSARDVPERGPAIPVVPDGRPAPDDLDRALAQAYQKTGDPAAQDQLVRRHHRLVWRIAWRYRGSGEPVEDLAQEGLIGLLRAIDRYDRRSPAKFSSYAARKIAGTIEHYLRDRGSAIRQPGWLQELVARIRREEHRLAQFLGRPPLLSEVAESLGVEEERVARALAGASTRTLMSLDEPAAGADPEGPSLGDVFGDAAAEAKAEMREDQIDLERAMGRLSDLHRRALTLSFYDDLTFEEVGGKLGIDRHRARRVVNQAVRILRNYLTPV